MHDAESSPERYSGPEPRSGQEAHHTPSLRFQHPFLEAEGCRKPGNAVWSMERRIYITTPNTALSTTNTENVSALQDPNTNRFKRTLIYDDTNTQYANFRRNPLRQATKRHLNVCILCVRVVINTRSFEPFSVWILF